MFRFAAPAAGVDPPYHPLAGEPHSGEDHGRDAEEAGGLQGLQAPAQAPQGAGEVSAGNQLQHPADQVTHQQPARFHALWGQDGVGKPQLYYSAWPSALLFMFFMRHLCFSSLVTGWIFEGRACLFLCLWNWGHCQCVAGPGAGREGLRGVAAHRDPPAREVGSPGGKVSPEGNKSWKLGERSVLALYLHLFLHAS